MMIVLGYFELRVKQANLQKSNDLIPNTSETVLKPKSRVDESNYRDRCAVF
jgi:hypothetical protein